VPEVKVLKTKGCDVTLLFTTLAWYGDKLKAEGCVHSIT